RFVYDPYGLASVLDSSWQGTTDGYNWRYLHQGGRFDAISELYYFRNRNYSPTLGRWMRQDPLGYVDGMGLYEYVTSTPALRTDPVGQTTTQPTTGSRACYALC